MPKFPTFSQLVTENDRQRGEKYQKTQGLFSVLLRDTSVLMDDLVSDPSKYEDGVYNLLLDLAAGRKKLESLAPEEMQLLDRAVIDFNHPRRDTPKPLPQIQPKATKAEETDEEKEVEYQEPTISPIRGVEPYWWLK